MPNATRSRFTANGLITITTDFGTRDGYVGAMKGVMLTIDPTLRLVDLAHDLPAQDVRHAALVLRSACPRFPVGTVHLAVVDPGVGGPRAPIALVAGGHAFVGPDNGLLSLVAAGLGRGAARRIARRGPLARFLPAAPSPTFHGRDVFAPTAAVLACGRVPFSGLGAEVRPARLTIARPRREGAWVRGEITHFDRFGNAVTNLAGEHLPARRARATVAVGARERVRLVETYAAAPVGELVAVVGSDGWLEIAVRDGSAREQSGLATGVPVRVGPARTA
jgi:S-adenosyl-L-methionine hydrolase (adenosine-forming)